MHNGRWVGILESESWGAFDEGLQTNCVYGVRTSVYGLIYGLESQARRMAKVWLGLLLQWRTGLRYTYSTFGFGSTNAENVD